MNSKTENQATYDMCTRGDDSGLVCTDYSIERLNLVYRLLGGLDGRFGQPKQVAGGTERSYTNHIVEI